MSLEKNSITREVKRLQAGDGTAFENLYNLTAGTAWFTALKIVKNEHDAQDVLQESYMVVLDKINNLENPEQFMSWFNMIVANKAKELLRKNNKYVFVDEPENPEVFGIPDEYDCSDDGGWTINPADITEKKDFQLQIMALIDNLSDDKRTVIMLYYFNELSVKQISESLDISEGTVKSRLFYAKNDLTKGIKEIEKKNGKFYGLAPIPLVVLALKASSVSSSAAFAASSTAAAAFTAASAGAGLAGSSAAVASSVAGGTAATATASAVATAGTAAAGTAAGTALASGVAAGGLATKIVAGITVAAVIGGSTAGTAKVVKQRKKQLLQTSVVTETVTEKENGLFETLRFTRRTTVQESRDFGGDGADTDALLSSGNRTTASERTIAVENSETHGSLESVEITTSDMYSATPSSTSKIAVSRSETTKEITRKATSSQQTARETSTERVSTSKAITVPSATTSPQTSTVATTAEQSTTQTTATTATTQKTSTMSTTDLAPKKAKVNITITRGGVYADATSVTLNAGDTFSFADAKAAVAAKGYDTAFAEYSGTLLPLTAEADKTYSITIDVE